MTANLPNKIPDLVAWANTRTNAWQQAGAAIGLSEPQIQAFTTLAEALSTTVQAADQARSASKGATLEQADAVAAFRALAAAYISIIKGFAESSGNVSVYKLAEISPDAPPGPAPEPVPPETFTATVNTSGSITLKFKVTQPKGVSGVSYLVGRLINGGTGVPVNLGTADRKKMFTDTTLPLGVDRVTYVITPTRGPVRGPDSKAFNIQFGSVAGGPPGVIATSVAAPASGMKLAA